MKVADVIFDYVNELYFYKTRMECAWLYKDSTDCIKIIEATISIINRYNDKFFSMLQQSH